MITKSVVLAGTIATAVARQSGTGKKVVVSNISSTTTVSDATVPTATSTTEPHPERVLRRRAPRWRPASTRSTSATCQGTAYSFDAIYPYLTVS